jgi:hypothetical protein
MRFESWVQRVRDFADLLDQDGTEPDDHVDDELHVDRLHDTLHLAGTFHGVAGDALYCEHEHSPNSSASPTPPPLAQDRRPRPT